METKEEPIRASEKIKMILMELFQKEPFSDITIREICEKSDCSKDTFYQLYGTREEILQNEFRERIRQSRDRLEEIRMLGYYICYCLEESRPLLRIFSGQGPGHLLHRELSDVTDPLVRKITAGKDRSRWQVTNTVLSETLTNAFLHRLQDREGIPGHSFLHRRFFRILRGGRFRWTV